MREKMKKYLILSAFLVLFFSIQAHASIYVYPTTIFTQFQPVDVAYNSTNISSAGLYDLYFYSAGSNSPVLYNTVGFCVMPDVQMGYDYANLDAITTDSFKAAAWMMDTYLPSADTYFKKTGLQLAIWYAMGFSGMTITDNGNNSYDEYLIYKAGFEDDFLSDWSADGYSIVNFIGKDTQDMIVKNPVPEPATMMLFGLGLLGISALGRKKK